MTETTFTYVTSSPPTEDASYQHWLLVATDRPSTSRRYDASELFRTRLTDRFWGFSAFTPNRRRIRHGDRAIIYLGGRNGGRAAADCLLASDPFPLVPAQRLRFSHNETVFWADYGVYLDRINVWEQPVPFTRQLIKQLTFIKSKERWGSALQGTLIPLPAVDYGTILAHRHSSLATVSTAQPTRFVEGTVPSPPSSVPSVLLGHETSAGAPVRWSPTAEKNPHLLVVGMSGAGKTETLRALIYELGKVNIPAVVVDVHNEFSGVSDRTIDLSAKIKLNPLEIVGRRPITVVYEVAGILRHIYRLGDQQEAVLRTALRQSYEACGITQDPTTWSRPPPSFTEVKTILEHMDAERQQRLPVRRLLNRLEPLFDMEVFARETYLPFHDIVTRTTSLQLHHFPTDAVKTSIADFLLRRLWQHTHNLGAADALRFYIVLDEAHRLAYETSPLEPFLREARKYGVGVLLSSQRPTDFSENVLANVAGIACLQCPLNKDARYMAQQISCHPEEIRTLTQRGEALVKFASSPYPHHIQVIPSFQRRQLRP